MEVFPVDIQKLISSFYGGQYNVFFELVKAEMHLRWFSGNFVYLGPFVDDGSGKNFVRLKKLPKCIVNNLPYGVTAETLVSKKLTGYELSDHPNTIYGKWDWSSFFECWLAYCRKRGWWIESPNDLLEYDSLPKIKRHRESTLRRR